MNVSIELANVHLSEMNKVFNLIEGEWYINFEIKWQRNSSNFKVAFEDRGSSSSLLLNQINHPIAGLPDPRGRFEFSAIRSLVFDRFKEFVEYETSRGENFLCISLNKQTGHIKIGTDSAFKGADSIPYWNTCLEIVPPGITFPRDKCTFEHAEGRTSLISISDYFSRLILYTGSVVELSDTLHRHHIRRINVYE